MRVFFHGVGALVVLAAAICVNVCAGASLRPASGCPLAFSTSAAAASIAPPDFRGRAAKRLSHVNAPGALGLTVGAAALAFAKWHSHPGACFPARADSVCAGTRAWAFFRPLRRIRALVDLMASSRQGSEVDRMTYQRSYACM